MLENIKSRLKARGQQPEEHKGTILDDAPAPSWVDRRTGKFQIYKAKDGWRWRLLSSNGKLVAESGEAYGRHFDCRKAVLKVGGVASAARIEDAES